MHYFFPPHIIMYYYIAAAVFIVLAIGIYFYFSRKKCSCDGGLECNENITCEYIMRKYEIVPGTTWGKLTYEDSDTPTQRAQKTMIRTLWQNWGCNRNPDSTDPIKSNVVGKCCFCATCI